MRRISFSLLSCLLFLLNSCISPRDKDPNELTGTAVGITDGDTFTFLSAGKTQKKIRLHGIDCPEKKQPFGNVAKQKLSELIFGKEVKVQKTSIDRYGRTVAMVYQDGRNINELMLQSGLAWHFIRYDNNPECEQMQITAQQQHLGLWSDPDPVAPWNWRRHKSILSN
jgi:micrococcal nuclease